MSLTKIEWSDRVWNPVTGCTKVSPGCDHCYAENIARRFAGGKSFPNGFDVTLRHDKLDEPRRWRTPSRVFVNSMSDLFHDDVPSAFIAAVFDVMRETPQHTYQILTKRHARMRSLMRSAAPGEGWPLPNVWLGVSVEDQKRADLRIPALLNTRARVRFLSCEPLLGPVDLGNVDWDGATGLTVLEHPPNGIDWVIVGGESGVGARRMELEWAASLVRQCRAAAVPVFVKQLGSAHGAHKGGDMDTWPTELRVREFPQAVAR